MYRNRDSREDVTPSPLSRHSFPSVFAPRQPSPSPRHSFPSVFAPRHGGASDLRVGDTPRGRKEQARKSRPVMIFGLLTRIFIFQSYRSLLKNYLIVTKTSIANHVRASLAIVSFVSIPVVLRVQKKR
jgi:hypothetical protein